MIDTKQRLRDLAVHMSKIDTHRRDFPYTDEVVIVALQEFKCKVNSLIHDLALGLDEKER